MSETNEKAGYEAVNEIPLGETQEHYDARMARIKAMFGPRDPKTDQEPETNQESVS